MQEADHARSRITQLAKLAGYKVIATASPKNFDLVKSYGADEVVDVSAARTWPPYSYFTLTPILSTSLSVQGRRPRFVRDQEDHQQHPLHRSGHHLRERILWNRSQRILRRQVPGRGTAQVERLVAGRRRNTKLGKGEGRNRGNYLGLYLPRSRKFRYGGTGYRLPDAPADITTRVLVLVVLRVLPRYDPPRHPR